jgi:hypothetical protein
MRARISKKGYEILANTKAADSLVKAIIENGEKFMSGETIEFQFESKEDPHQILKQTVQIVTSASTLTQ